MPAFDAAHRPAETDAHGLWRLDPDHARVRRDDPDAARAQVFGKAGARPRPGHLQPQMETIRMRGVFGATQDTCGEARTDERRVGKAGGSTCGTRLAADEYTKKTKEH